MREYHFLCEECSHHRVRVLLQGLTVDLIVTHLVGDNTDKSSFLSLSQSQYIMLLGMVWM